MDFHTWLESSPIIIRKRDEYDTLPYIDIRFPSGKMWRYIFPSQMLMNHMLDSHRRNVGRLVARIKDHPQVQQQMIETVEEECLTVVNPTKAELERLFAHQPVLRGVVAEDGIYVTPEGCAFHDDLRRMFGNGIMFYLDRKQRSIGARVSPYSHQGENMTKLKKELTKALKHLNIKVY